MKFGRRTVELPVPAVPTAVDITAAMLDRAATALMAAEASERLTDIYGRVGRARARDHAMRALEAALDLRWESS